ncbi:MULTISPECIES: hypothetical protein [Buttiauxella]|uniref:hypothetical protein n=1 Tax=Buttiauxella TaxID=82976 RepID=UPI00106639AF|nr:hypothetical protein [Buttiauxella sp. BIGb0552]TDX12028.1 hypothetical protein EDF88_4626 [Buttiauxella sp. BIGb0552]
MKLNELKGTERELVVIALQALFRERKSACNAVITVCNINGQERPNEEVFGLDEVFTALREIGAAPI